MIRVNRILSHIHKQDCGCALACVNQVHIQQSFIQCKIHVCGLDHGHLHNLQYHYQRVNLTQLDTKAGYTGMVMYDYVMRGVRQ